MSAGGRRCRDACFATPRTCSAGRNIQPLIGCRASGGGSGGHTELARVIGAVDMPAGRVWIAYIKQDLRASQFVATVPVTGSLVCISWFNLRNTTETVSLPRRRTSGDTDWINRAEFQVWLQTIPGDCSMDADSSVLDNREGNTFDMDLFVPWDAPESMVNVSSAGVVLCSICRMVWDWWVIKKMRQRVASYRVETLVVSGCLFRTAGGSTRIFRR